VDKEHPPDSDAVMRVRCWEHKNHWHVRADFVIPSRAVADAIAADLPKFMSKFGEQKVKYDFDDSDRSAMDAAESIDIHDWLKIHNTDKSN
jgi:hypothetical protein